MINSFSALAADKGEAAWVAFACSAGAAIMTDSVGEAVGAGASTISPSGRGDSREPVGLTAGLTTKRRSRAITVRVTIVPNIFDQGRLRRLVVWRVSIMSVDSMVICLILHFSSILKYSAMEKQNHQSGLTLLELMLVVMVMGILMLAGFTNWWLQLSKANDSNRKTDLEKMRLALFHYEADKSCYPDPSLVVCGSKDLAPYIDKVLCEPDGSSFYYERPTCGKFIIFTKLDYTKDPVIRDKGCLVGCGPGYSYNYYVQEGMEFMVDFLAVPSGDIPDLSPVRPSCGTQTKYCYSNICSSCCPGSKYRCSSGGDWCIPDSSCR